MTTLISQEEMAALMARYREEEEDDQMTEEPKEKRRRLTEVTDQTEQEPQFDKTPEARGTSSSSASGFFQSKGATGCNKFMRSRIESGNFRKIPPQLFRTHILKFLSSADLISCSLVCRFLNYAASDDSFWRRLYCMRWGVLPRRELLECSWKRLYLQRDEEDIAELVSSCPLGFKECYIQMQVTKRSQVPLPSQVTDDGLILDKAAANQVSAWRRSRGLTDKVATGHACYGETCTYYQIGDAFVCEKTGSVHVCDDNCTEVAMDSSNGLWVCTISGKCYDSLISTEVEHSVIVKESFPDIQIHT